MKFNYNGHQYTYNQYSNVLTDSTGAQVARVSLAKDAEFDQYNHFIDIKIGTCMYSEFDRDDLSDRDMGYELARQYEAFNE